MTATSTPARSRAAVGGGRAAPLTIARLLWIELRRNSMPWILPVIAVLFWFDSYRPSVATEPLWAVRTFWNMGQGHTIIDFGPFVAGVAAWMGSRDRRRGTADLVTAAARPRWVSELVAWAATAIWAVGAYLAFVGVMFAVYAHQGVKGSPPWWWVAVGATAVAAFSALGFAAGEYLPSRFAAPLAAFGGFLAIAMSSQTGFRSPSGWALILPTNSNGNFQPDSGVFYPWLPDLPIARIMFLAGIAVAAVGLTGLPARVGGPWLRRAAAVVTLAGVATAGTAVGLVDTARLGPHGIVIPALHDAANDRPIRFTPVCGRAGGIPVCVNPAYRRWLPDVTDALRPVLVEMAALPGAPARAAQVAVPYSGGEGPAPLTLTLGGRPPVLRMPLGAFNMPGQCGFCDGPVAETQFAVEVRLQAVDAFVGPAAGPGTPAQHAVEAALMRIAGTPFNARPASSAAQPAPLASGVIRAAARRFAALPAGTRHAWLAAHLGALRAGQVTLGQLP